MYFPSTVLATVPTAEPISRAEAKLWTKIDASDDDVVFDWCITAARLYVEKITNRALVTQGREMYPERFPCESQIIVPHAPLISIAEFEWTDTAGTTREWTVSGGNLLSGSTVMAHVDAIRQPGRIVLAYGQSWPSETLKTSNPIRISYNCGYGAASAVPQDLKNAMAVLIEHWYRNRSAVVVGQVGTIASAQVQLTFDALIANYICAYA